MSSILNEIVVVKILIFYHQNMKIVIRIVFQQTEIRKIVHYNVLRSLRIVLIHTLANIFHSLKKFKLLLT